MMKRANSSGASGVRRRERWWKRWIPSRNVRVLIAYVAIRLVFTLIRILVDD